MTYLELEGVSKLGYSEILWADFGTPNSFVRSFKDSSSKMTENPGEITKEGKGRPTILFFSYFFFFLKYIGFFGVRR